MLKHSLQIPHQPVFLAAVRHCLLASSAGQRVCAPHCFCEAVAHDWPPFPHGEEFESARSTCRSTGEQPDDAYSIKAMRLEKLWLDISQSTRLTYLNIRLESDLACKPNIVDYENYWSRNTGLSRLREYNEIA